MNAPELQQMIDAAIAYESFFVPALFLEWAPRLADAARVGPGDRVLDVACGTGVLAREAASRVGPRGSVTGVDINPGMLEVAARTTSAIRWQQGAAESLPFPDASFDAVVSQFGLMFFSDRPRALREMIRVLVPGGRLAVAVWDSLEHTPAYAAEVALLERIGGPRAAEPLRAPFVLGDRQALAAVMASADIPSATISTLQGRARFPNIRAVVEADLRGWLPICGVVLSEGQIQTILAEAEVAMADYVTKGGTAEFDTPAHIVTATKGS